MTRFDITVVTLHPYFRFRQNAISDTYHSSALFEAIAVHVIARKRSLRRRMNVIMLHQIPTCLTRAVRCRAYVIFSCTFIYLFSDFTFLDVFQINTI